MTDGQGMEHKGDQPSDKGRYNVNFFKPKSAHSRADMKLITVLIIIWAVAVFGFQFLLMATTKPTPEPAYGAFQEVWDGIKDGTADIAAQQKFSRSLLSVLGKNIAVKAPDKVILQKSLSWSASKLIPATQKALIDTDVQTEVIATAIGLSGIGFDKLMTDLLPTSIIPLDSETLSDSSKDALPGIMELYLVHNRSKLTDTPFLGFPFHYWYTAQFLLIMFVVMCLVYAVLIDKINTKYDFTEK